MHAKPLFTVVLLALMSIALAQEPVPPIPPEPVQPAQPEILGKDDVPREQREAARAKWKAALEKWRQDRKAWEAALSPAQKALLKQQREEAEARRKEDFARAQRLPLPTDGYSWQEAARHRLDQAGIEQLGRDKLAYGPTVKQSFTPYLGGPVFITSDSLLNAFHVLFEDTFREYELRQYTELRKQLETVLRQARANLEKATFPRGDTAAAWRHAQMVVGPAMSLLGSPEDLFDPELRPEIQAQLAKIRAAAEQSLPEWLAPAQGHLSVLDYTACKPIGFYAADEKLADYFRAVRWLQLVPFRANRDVELAAIGMLGYGVNQAYQSHSERYFRTYSLLLGGTDSRDLPEAAHEFQNFFLNWSGETWPDLLRDKKRWSLRLLMSQEAWMELPKGTLPPDADARLAALEYHVLPAYVPWDSQLFQQLADAQLEPEGLAVAMMLGSSYARAHLGTLKPEQVEAAAKRLETPATSREPRREASLYDAYLGVLRTLNQAPPPDAPDFMRGEAWQLKSTQTTLSAWAQMRHTFTLQARRSEYYFGIAIVPPGFVEPNPDFFARMADLIERARPLFNANHDRWDELASVARKLEALAHKQLRKQAWSPEDDRFLKSYGERIAGVMGYAGNSYEVPNDDAPRWTEVHHNQPEGYSLAVAVGRPRILYVLYPWNGMEILCQGSVLPYFEYRSRQRLTDAEWKTLLDSPEAPRQPGWLRATSAK